MSQDLEKARQIHTAIEEPRQALNGIDAKLNTIEERLKSLEQAHDKINQRMLQMVEKMHEMYDNAGILKLIKRSLSNSFIAQKTPREKPR